MTLLIIYDRFLLLLFPFSADDHHWFCCFDIWLKLQPECACPLRRHCHIWPWLIKFSCFSLFLNFPALQWAVSHFFLLQLLYLAVSHFSWLQLCYTAPPHTFPSLIVTHVWPDPWNSKTPTYHYLSNSNLIQCQCSGQLWTRRQL